MQCYLWIAGLKFLGGLGGCWFKVIFMINPTAGCIEVRLGFNKNAENKLDAIIVCCLHCQYTTA